MKQFTTITLIADKGMKLTDGKEYYDSVNFKEGVRNPDDYSEVTIAEYDAVMAERAAAEELNGGGS